MRKQVTAIPQRDGNESVECGRPRAALHHRQASTGGTARAGARKTARPSIRAEPGRAAGPRPRRLPTSVVASVQKFRYDTGEAITQPKQITGTGPSVPPAEVTGENQGAPHRGIIRLLNLRGKLSQRHAPSSASYCIRTRSTASVRSSHVGQVCDPSHRCEERHEPFSIDRLHVRQRLVPDAVRPSDLGKRGWSSNHWNASVAKTASTDTSSRAESPGRVG